MDIEEIAKNARERIGQNKSGETEEERKERLKRVFEQRNEVMKKIYDYQDKTGIPSEEEKNKHFFENEIKN